MCYGWELGDGKPFFCYSAVGTERGCLAEWPVFGEGEFLEWHCWFWWVRVWGEVRRENRERIRRGVVWTFWLRGGLLSGNRRRRVEVSLGGVQRSNVCGVGCRVGVWNSFPNFWRSFETCYMMLFVARKAVDHLFSKWDVASRSEGLAPCLIWKRGILRKGAERGLFTFESHLFTQVCMSCFIVLYLLQKKKYLLKSRIWSQNETTKWMVTWCWPFRGMAMIMRETSILRNVVTSINAEKKFSWLKWVGGVESRADMLKWFVSLCLSSVGLVNSPWSIYCESSWRYSSRVEWLE